MNEKLELEQRGDEVRLSVRVQPRASRCRIAGTFDGALKVQLSAPPVDDRANRQLVEFLASEFQLPKHAVRLISGAKSRRKKVSVVGLDERSIRHRLAPYLL